MKADFLTTETTSIAASVAPEDLKCGDFVAVLNEVVELPSFLWLDSVPGTREQLVRVRCLPSGSNLPLKIKAICLPFVFVQSVHGHGECLDIRRMQLVRLDDCYAKTVWRKVRQRSQCKLKTGGR
jgi:hypothetical protein